MSCGGAGTAGTGGMFLSTPGMIKNLRVHSATNGFGAGSGVITVKINGVASGVTCTIGTGANCSDTTNSATYAAGDLVTVSFTILTGETLSNLSVSFETWVTGN